MALRNRVKEASKTGRIVRGVHMTYPAAHMIEIFGLAEMDFVYFDGEHGAFTANDLAEGCRTANLAGLTPIARLPNAEPSTVTHYLDRGVMGVIIPHVESVAQAEAVIGAAYFAPLGERSYGGARPEFNRRQSTLGGDYFDSCNERTSVSLMIETPKGLEIASQLARLPGVDYLSFGLFDLAQSLGHRGNPRHPAVQEQIESAAARIREAGKPIRGDFIQFTLIDHLVLAGCEALLPKTQAPAS